MTTKTVTASNVRPSTYVERPGAVDVDVVVMLQGAGAPCAPRAHRGEVTLVPDHTGTLVAYGDCRETWISGALLSEIRACDDQEQSDIVIDIERAARAAAEVSQ
jgi:hypothetical protein